MKGDAVTIDIETMLTGVDDPETMKLLEERGDWAAAHKKNFPQASKGLFAGKLSLDSKARIMADSGDIFLYRYIEINTKGRALIALRLAENSPRLETVKFAPNFEVRDKDGNREVIYLLEKFLPANASNHSLKFYRSVIRRLEIALQAKHIYQGFCFNPFSIYHQTTRLTEKRYNFEELNTISKLGVEEIKKRQANAGKESAATRKNQSVQTILGAISTLQSTGTPVTQVKVAKISGLGRSTVIRNWTNKEVQVVLGNATQNDAV